MDADIELATLTSLLDLDGFEVVEAMRDRRNKLQRFTLVPKVAVTRLKRGCEQGARMALKALEQFNKTLENWMDKIANYFVHRSSNGRTEGFNRGLRAILWRACGMRNFGHFRLRVFSCSAEIHKSQRVSRRA